MNLYKTVPAALFIDGKFPESLEYWRNFLINNRRPGRNPAYRIPCEKLSGDIVYTEEALLQFIEWEQHRREGSIGLSRYTYLDKRQFDFHVSNNRFSKEFEGFFSTEIDSKTNKPFISLRLHNPRHVYTLDLEKAEHLRDMLNNIIDKIQSK